MKFDPQAVMRDHALAVLADPSSTHRDRTRAREHLAAGGGDLSVLTDAEVAELDRIVSKMLDAGPGR